MIEVNNKRKKSIIWGEKKVVAGDNFGVFSGKVWNKII